LIAVDTNVLVYAHRVDSTFHRSAAATVARLAESRTAWAIPWTCIHEFLAVTTHPRIFDPPTPIAAALDQVQAWLESPSLCLLHEANDHWGKLRGVLHASGVTGPRVHDAHIAAICLSHGVTELWSVDRDYTRFPALRVKNPLAAVSGPDAGRKD
jgi:toxin-antitoxin system PIN domain toxin